jgi:hypothetical protein
MFRRFLPEYDNLLLAHADRSRIVADDHRRQVFTSGGLLLGTVLLDGFVGGRWKLTRQRDTATLIVEPFQRISRPDRAAVADEGARLLDVVAADARNHDVRISAARR